MGRDHDPFDRTLAALRRRLAKPDGALDQALAIKSLAHELGVSPTPVREALAVLYGEGLVTRGQAGYARLGPNAASLADLYDMAQLLALAALTNAAAELGAGAGDLAEDQVRDGSGDAEADPFDWRLGRLIDRSATPVLARTYHQIRAQLAPFARAEARVLGPADVGALAAAHAAGAPSLARLLRAHFARRRRKSAEILAAALIQTRRI